MFEHSLILPMDSIKRESPWGFFIPLMFFGWNIFSWLLTALRAGAHDLLWLSLLPASVMVVYVLLIVLKRKR